MARSNLPKFGNWEEENISYTAYFENARRVSSSEKVNPGSSPENPDMISKQEPIKKSEATRVKHERMVSKEDGELTRQVASPSRPDGGRTPKRVPRPTGVDNSPLHPHYQAKIAAKESVMSSPSRERRGSSEGVLSLAPFTPGRSRLKSGPRGNETPDQGSSVPKFGEWDETDPSSADGYSYIFSKVKEERHGSVGNASAGSTQAQSNGQKRYGSKNSKGCCCFPWGGN